MSDNIITTGAILSGIAQRDQAAKAAFCPYLIVLRKGFGIDSFLSIDKYQVDGNGGYVCIGFPVPEINMKNALTAAKSMVISVDTVDFSNVSQVILPASSIAFIVNVGYTPKVRKK